MTSKSLGETIKELRLAQGISLRKFASIVDVVPAFMSDIELGKRYPSDDVLHKIAKNLQTPFEDLKACDVRESVTEIRKMVHGNIQWGIAFRTVAEKVKETGLTPEDFIKHLDKISQNKPNKKKPHDS